MGEGTNGPLRLSKSSACSLFILEKRLISLALIKTKYTFISVEMSVCLLFSVLRAFLRIYLGRFLHHRYVKHLLQISIR